MSTTVSDLMTVASVRAPSARVGDALSSAGPLLVAYEQGLAGIVPPEALAHAPAQLTLGELAAQLPPPTVVEADAPAGVLAAARDEDPDVGWFAVRHEGAWVGAVSPAMVERAAARSGKRRRSWSGRDEREAEVEPDWRDFGGDRGFRGGEVFRGGELFGDIDVPPPDVWFECPADGQRFPLAQARGFYDTRRRVICPVHRREMLRHVGG